MAFTRNIRLEDLGKYERQLARNAPLAARRIIEKTAREGVKRLQATTDKVDAVATGKLRRGWRVVRGGKGISFTITNQQHYALFVERGRRRGAKQPPIKPIEQWVRRRLDVPGKEVKSVAFAIARSISKRGIKGRFIAFKSMSAIIAMYRRNLDAEYAKYLRKGGKS